VEIYQREKLPAIRHIRWKSQIPGGPVLYQPLMGGRKGDSGDETGAVTGAKGAVPTGPSASGVKLVGRSAAAARQLAMEQ
jgi:hypothetical protein